VISAGNTAGNRYFSRLYTFLLKDHRLFYVEDFPVFAICSYVTPLNSVRSCQRHLADNHTTIWAIYATVRAKFNRNLKLIDTSSQEGRSPFCQLPAVLTQSRITGRPNVKVFNGSTPYRQAIRWKRERARSGEKGEREYGGNRGGMECGPPFLLFRAVYFSRENSVA